MHTRSDGRMYHPRSAGLQGSAAYQTHDQVQAACNTLCRYYRDVVCPFVLEDVGELTQTYFRNVIPSVVRLVPPSP